MASTLVLFKYEQIRWEGAPYHATRGYPIVGITGNTYYSPFRQHVGYISPDLGNFRYDGGLLLDSQSNADLPYAYTFDQYYGASSRLRHNSNVSVPGIWGFVVTPTFARPATASEYPGFPTFPATPDGTLPPTTTAIDVFGEKGSAQVVSLPKPLMFPLTGMTDHVTISAKGNLNMFDPATNFTAAAGASFTVPYAFAPRINVYWSDVSTVASPPYITDAGQVKYAAIDDGLLVRWQEVSYQRLYRDLYTGSTKWNQNGIPSASPWLQDWYKNTFSVYIKELPPSPSNAYWGVRL